MQSPRAPERFPGIDVLRALAATAVVLSHANKTEGGILFSADTESMLGRWGVGIFFLLSGLCIHLPAARALAAGEPRQLDPAAYFRRRFRRIYPPHFVALVLSAVVAWLLPVAAAKSTLIAPPTGSQFALHVVMLHTFVPTAYYSINCVLWTIALETHFYLLYPVILRLRTRVRLEWIFVAALGVSFAVRALALSTRAPVFGTLLHNFPGRWWEWVLGACVAEWLAKSTRAPRSRGFALGMALAVGSAVLEVILLRRRHGIHLTEVAMPFAFALVLLFAAPMQVPKNRFTKTLVDVGLQSYSLYLVHPIAMTILVALVPASFTPWASLIAVIAGSYLLASAFFALVERPFLAAPAPHARPAEPLEAKPAE